MQRVEDLVLRLRSIGEARPRSDALERADTRFKTALADDLNISAALAALFDLIRELNILCDEQKLGTEEALAALQLFARWDHVLGVLPLHKKSEEIPVDLLGFLSQRESARKEKNWTLSDQMRDAIYARGYVIEDTPQGARLKKK